jgi:transposase, IS30 family
VDSSTSFLPPSGKLITRLVWRKAESARSGRYLSLLERQRIATLRERGLGVREIARRLGRSPSTISRELRRHLRPHDRGIYDGDLAHARARERSRRPRRPLLSREPELRQIVQDKLKEEWSPAQIAAHLRETYPDRPDGICATRPSTRPSTTAEKAA